MPRKPKLTEAKVQEMFIQLRKRCPSEEKWSTAVKLTVAKIAEERPDLLNKFCVFAETAEQYPVNSAA